MRALIYARVSQDATGQGRSVGEQEKESRQECDRRGWDVVDVLVDNHMSASRYGKRTRPGWAEVLRRLSEREADVLVVWEASRATRSMDGFVALRTVCRSADVLLCWSGKLVDVSTADGSFTAALDLLLSERETDVTSERIRRAMRASAERGRPPGRRLFGYERTYDPNTGALTGQVPHPDESATVREAVDRVLSGEVPYRVVVDFNERGVSTPSRGEWDVRRLKRMLVNPHYAARRVHRGEVVGDADWEPIITRDEHSALVSMYASADRRRFMTSGTRHLLSGIGRCGVCATPIYVQTVNRNSPRYACKKGSHVVRSERDLDAYVSQLMIARLSALYDDPGTDQLDDAERVAEGDVVALQSRLEEARRSYAAGGISLSTLESVEGDLRNATRDAENRAKRARSRRLPPQMLGSDAALRWQALELEQRRTLIRALMSVTVLPAGRGKRRFDPDDVRIDWL